jgi:protein involved in polysaccharide export with SLBB domain
MRILMALFAIVVMGLTPLAAQLPLTTDPGRAVRTRADLERLLVEYDAAVASPAYSEGVKRSIRTEAQRVRERLERGDFNVGDRVYVFIQGESNYPDTVLVEPGPMVALEPFGQVSLAGVLRSELTDHLTQELARFIRMPVVRADALMRVAVLGGVGRPGFYTMPAETLLGDLLMTAGGPAPNANLEDLRIERAGIALYDEDVTQEALRAGLTLDQMNLEAGDQIVVPTRSTSSRLTTIISIAGAIGTLSFLLTRIGVF